MSVAESINGMRLLYVVLVVCAVSVGVGEGVEVVLQQGTLRGKKEVLEDGRHYYTFLSIPYAQPPLGDLKFKVSCCAFWNKCNVPSLPSILFILHLNCISSKNGNFL